MHWDIEMYPRVDDCRILSSVIKVYPGVLKAEKPKNDNGATIQYIVQSPYNIISNVHNEMRGLELSYCNNIMSYI